MHRIRGSNDTMQSKLIFLVASTTLLLSACGTDSAIEQVEWQDIPQMSLPATIEVGETVSVQIWNDCGIVIEIAENWYLPDRQIAPTRRSSSDFLDSDFKPDWNVAVYETEDGPGWVILDAEVTRIDDTTLEVTHQGTGNLIANFKLDPTPAEERQYCG